MKDLLEQLKAVTWRKSIFFAIAVLAVYTLICGFFRPILWAIGCALILLYGVAAFIIVRRDRKTDGLLAEGSTILGITLDFVIHFRMPITILSDDGKLIWYNNAFLAASGSGRSLYGKNAAEVVNSSLTVARLSQLKSGATFTMAFREIDYELSGYKLNSGTKSFCMIVFDDISPLLSARRELMEQNAVVAFIMLDNIGDAVQFSQDNYRSVSAKAAEAISEWAKSLSGLVKEYERDKYLLIFEERKLEEVLNAKFDILDTIRELEPEESVVPITASIGITTIKGGFGAKEASAQAALELALQRGGDQAVLRTEGSTEYYGGKSKSVQKKTKVRSRVMAGELSHLIGQSGNVLIMGHKCSDHDSIASCVAVARIATYLGKEAKIVINLHDANLKPIFNRMRGHTYYQDLFTDAPSAQDMLRSDTLLIICDVNNPELFESREIYENCVNYCILDHHRKTQEEYTLPPKLAYIEPSASSASELLTELVECLLPAGTLTKIESELLLAGIILDTKNFRKNTGVKTFSAALYLRSLGAEPDDAQVYFRTDLTDFKLETKLENNFYLYRDSIAIARCEIAAESASRAKLVSSQCADRLLNISEVEASFVLAPIGRDINISARSNGNLNVQWILEQLGGGGHFDAAGALLRDCSLAEAEQALKGAIDKRLSDKKA